MRPRYTVPFAPNELDHVLIKACTYKSTFPISLHILQRVIEEGFAIQKCCKGFRKLVFQNPWFLVSLPFLRSLAFLHIKQWHDTLNVIVERGRGIDPLLNIFNILHAIKLQSGRMALPGPVIIMEPEKI